ncbi:response regulator transcription factor [Hazenella sp. IB182357]|uniref:Response regulator transcription factor n=1 Tax=Polycladospora coralii TaxID=2771432 RepID=A0A926N7V6_9BACL|nr:response regulator transcription factor [Polycladospora coralii]MBD1371691.1 response regulator transcription factor [Polycladospora coralii]
MLKYKILIIEDEKRIREELNEYLENVGYETATVIDFSRILTIVKEVSPDLILLDLNLPYIDGYTIHREIKKLSDIPIIMVTSRDTEMDELMSMSLGADDFITKPYNLQILMARIEAVLKRVYSSERDNFLSYHGMKLNVASGTIEYQSKEQILTKNELKILYFLIKHKGSIVSREQMMEYLWSADLFVDDNTLSVNITRLRKKLEQLGISNLIETRRGMGYILP